MIGKISFSILMLNEIQRYRLSLEATWIFFITLCLIGEKILSNTHTEHTDVLIMNNNSSLPFRNVNFL